VATRVAPRAKRLEFYALPGQHLRSGRCLAVAPPEKKKTALPEAPPHGRKMFQQLDR